MNITKMDTADFVCVCVCVFMKKKSRRGYEFERDQKLEGGEKGVK